MADAATFEEQALPHLDALYRAAWAMSRNHTVAEDLVQTTMLKALKRFGSFRTGSNCKAWLMRILRNTWIDRLRHRKVVGPEAPVEEELLPGSSDGDESTWSEPEQLMERFGDEQVIHALADLPGDQRMTLFLIDVEELSQEEVAEIMDVAVGTVKSRTSRARNALKERLTEHAKDLGFLGRVS